MRFADKRIWVLGGGSGIGLAVAQAAAANAALNAFSRELLSSHIRSCVVNDVRAGNDEIVDELLDTLQKLMK